VNAGARAAGVVVVRPTAAGWRYLLLRVYRNWDFPKGLVEAGEAPIAAALREVREETTLDGLALRWGEAFAETAPYARGKVARYYVAASAEGDVRLPISPELGRPEHHEFRWVTAGEAQALLPPRLHPILAWARALVEPA
jgi:bis(5'-nucleosidyl)-tetraphosphatase